MPSLRSHFLLFFLHDMERIFQPKKNHLTPAPVFLPLKIQVTWINFSSLSLSYRGINVSPCMPPLFSRSASESPACQSGPDIFVNANFLLNPKECVPCLSVMPLPLLSMTA